MAECLFGTLVDLGQEGLEDLLLQSLRFVDVVDLGAQLANNALLILLVDLLQIQLLVDGLNLGLKLAVLAAVRSLKHFALFRVATLESLVDQPRALVILDIGTDLADEGGVTVGIEVVILDLEVLTQGDEDVMGLTQVLGGRELEVVQSHGDGEVEAIVCGLVGDDEHVLLHGEVVQVDIVLGGGDQVTELAQLGLEGGLVEELNEVDVGGVRPEVLLQNDVDAGLEEEGVVDGDQADTGMLVPAGLTAAGDGAVHNVIADQEESLEQLGEPAQQTEVLELLIGQGLLQESEAGVGDGETTVELSTGDVDVEGLL